jgi:CBS domain-containing protein
MTYWIYNMGLPVPIRDERLFVKRAVEPLSALNRSKKIYDTDYKEDQDENNTVTTHVNLINSTYQDHTNSNRKLVCFADEIMSHPVITLADNISWEDASQKFKQYKFHHFPIVNADEQLIGMVSDRDMLAHATIHQMETILLHRMETIVLDPLSTLMTRSVVTASPKTNIRDICRVMFNQYIGAMPITNGNDDLLGIITRSDILRTIIKNEPIEFWI